MTTLGACAAEQADSADALTGDAAQLAMIRFEAYYSAFGGKREYHVAPSLSEAALSEDGVDPVLADSLVWNVDPAFATQETYDKLPGAVLLTTRAAGTTRIEVRATTTSGRRVRDSVPLEITAANDELFAMGVDAFDASLPSGPKASAERMTKERCGVDMSFSAPLRCKGCHVRRRDPTNLDAPQFEHELYSDRKLIDMFANGGMPDDYMNAGPFLRVAPLEAARCYFELHHSADVPHEIALGLVFRLRSFPPP
jgi:hypothetical protein